jgi:hypothetical protein
LLVERERPNLPVLSALRDGPARPPSAARVVILARVSPRRLENKEGPMPPRHRVIRGLAAVAVACCLAVWPARAQAQNGNGREDGRALVVSLYGGQYGPLTHLDDDAWVEFKTGINVGGGLAYRVNRHVALRANYTFVRAELRDVRSEARTALAGDTFNRHLIDGDLQLRYPLQFGVTPFAFLGGGVVTVGRAPERDPSRFTKPAARIGGGLSYGLPHSDLSLYVQGAGWIYKWDRYGFDSVQFDTTLSGGISYRFGL